jgi:hypothetical protein
MDMGHAKQYLGIATILIESSALYGVWSIIFIGLYAANNLFQQVFLGTLSDVAVSRLSRSINNKQNK